MDPTVPHDLPRDEDPVPRGRGELLRRTTDWAWPLWRGYDPNMPEQDSWEPYSGAPHSAPHSGVPHIGTSGWSYDHWENVLYPPGLPARDRLAHYASRFTTVELNASFYRWPRESSFASWQRRLPEGFAMSVKAPRGLSHGKKLYGPEVWTERIGRGWHELGDKRAVLLVQLPPDFARDDARLDYFLAALPDWIRVSVEFRHASWDHPAVYGLLERHGAAYCVMSGANLPCILRATAPFVYVRLHGPDHEHLYAGSYSDQELGWWADRIREWQAAGRDVYAYFNNDGGGNAVRNAATLRELLGDA